MRTKQEKVLFLKEYQAGRRKIAELLSVHEIDFVQIQGQDFFTNRETGQRYSPEEFEELERNSPINQLLLVLTWSSYFPPPPLPCTKEQYLKYIDQLFPSREEDVDLTPYSFK